MLVLVKILTWSASPIGIFILAGGFGLVLAKTKKGRTVGQTLAAVGVIQFLVFSSPLVSERLISGLETSSRVLEQEAKSPDLILDDKKFRAILLLGGATLPASPPERPHPDLLSSADRIWHAARLYKSGIAPQIILSGGKRPGLEGKDVQSEAEGMALLLQDLGVPRSSLILESDSRTTRENAQRVKTIVGDGSVAVVTSAFHMPRAIATLKNAGIKANAFPTDFRVAPAVEPLWIRLLPSAGALQDSETALKEYLALLINY